MSMRQEVLGLYRRVIRLSYKWTSARNSAAETEAERKYIREEAQKLFRKNKEISEEDDIREHIREGEARYEIALHYKTPYPRPVHAPQHVLHTTASKRLKTQKRKLKESKPVYMRSYDDES